MNRTVRAIFWIGLGVLVGILVVGTWTPTHAYPEYASRTGEQCTACHVNPAGGGPRTLRGLLWIAEGRPDTVPPLPGSDQPTESEEVDGAALFENRDCALCHGPNGEGDAGPALTETDWSADEVTDIIVNGVGAMKGYGTEAFSQAELEALVSHVQAIGRGEIQSTIVLQKRLLPPPQFPCNAEPLAPIPRNGCGGN